MVSSAMAVLPVWRSPMSSSRWPRPMGIIVSMALMPVAMGSRTDWRSMTPGARRSTGRILVGVDGALVVDGLTERVDDAADHGFADGHGHDLAGALDGVAFFDLGVVAEEDGADLVFVEVHGEAGYAVGEFDELAGHDLVEAVDAGDTVAEGDDGADLVDLDALLEVLNLLAKQFSYLIRLDLCHVFLLLDSYQSEKLEPRL